MEKTMLLDLKGLKCAGCVAAVEQAAGALPGVKSAKVDLATAKGTFVVDEDVVKVEEIIEAIREAGYDAKQSKP
jgi:copper chaperone CopZ